MHRRSSMVSRAVVLLTIGVAVCGCGDGEDVRREQSGEQGQDTESGGELGAPGSHIWFETSSALELKTHWSYNPVGKPPESGESCEGFSRHRLSAAQLEVLT